MKLGTVFASLSVVISSIVNAIPLDLQWGQSKESIEKNWALVESSPYGGYVIDKNESKEKNKIRAFDKYYMEILPENGLCSMIVTKNIPISYSGAELVDSYGKIKKILNNEFGRSVPMGEDYKKIKNLDDPLMISIRAGNVSVKEGWSRKVGSKMINGINAVYLSIDEVNPFDYEAKISITYDGYTKGCKEEMDKIKEIVYKNS